VRLSPGRGCHRREVGVEDRLRRERQPASHLPVETIPWRTLERHPDVQDLLIRRLAQQPDRSIREAKRLINVWQLYERVLTSTNPLTEPADAIYRAQHLILLAEIVTRWPALQRTLHHRADGTTALQQLAAAADDDDTAWLSTISQLSNHPAQHQPALANLRNLLREHDATAIADLAAQLL
jgi:hypothetical protein